MKSHFLLSVALAILSQGAGAEAPVFDSHVHLWNGETSVEAYQAQLREQGQEVAGFGAMWFGGLNQALAGEPEQVRAGNDGIIALASRHPRLLPIATVHPYDGEAALAELARVAAKGVKVVKIHPHTQKFDAADPRVLRLVQRAGELGLIVLMDNAGIVPDDNEELFDLALAAPGTQFIFAHMGAFGFRFWNILAAARTADGLFAENIHFDISAIVAMVAESPIEAEFVWTMRNVGVDRILIGSDYPQFSLARNLSALERLGLSEEEKAKIRFGNAQKLFGLAEPER